MLLYGLCSSPFTAAELAHTTSACAQYKDNLLTYATNTADGQVMLNPMRNVVIFASRTTIQSQCKKLSLWWYA